MLNDSVAAVISPTKWPIMETKLDTVCSNDHSYNVSIRLRVEDNDEHCTFVQSAHQQTAHLRLALLTEYATTRGHEESPLQSDERSVT